MTDRATLSPAETERHVTGNYGEGEPLSARETIIARLLRIPAEIQSAEACYAEASENEAQATAALALGDEIKQYRNETERKAFITRETEALSNEASRARIQLHVLQNEFSALRSVARVIGGE